VHFETIKLFKKKTGSNEQEEFILLHDKQVGFEKAQFPECLIEMKQDDDVDTDEEIFDNALKACSRDFNDTRLKLETLSLNTFINNCDIKNRVARPEFFDRNGKFCAYNQNATTYHPSMDAIQLARQA